MLEALLLGFVRDCLFLLGHLTGRSSFEKPLPAAEEAACVRAMRAGVHAYPSPYRTRDPTRKLKPRPTFPTKIPRKRH